MGHISIEILLFVIIFLPHKKVIMEKEFVMWLQQYPIACHVADASKYMFSEFISDEKLNLPERLKQLGLNNPPCYTAMWNQEVYHF